MKTKATQNVMKSVIVAILSTLVLAGCGNDNENVPKAYQGVFQDQSGVRLDLTGNAAQLQVEGKTLKEPVSPLTYDTLLAGTPGFYIYQANKDAKIMDVYMVTPDISTKKEAGGIIYYTTDIVYMQIDLSQQSAVASITIVHADLGTVMLDTSAKTWEAGWPAHASEYNLVRTAAQSELKI